MTASADSHGESLDGPARDLLCEVHLLRDELCGLREMLDGVTRALKGAQQAYAAVAQRADLLEERLRRMSRSGTAI